MKFNINKTKKDFYKVKLSENEIKIIKDALLMYNEYNIQKVRNSVDINENIVYINEQNVYIRQIQMSKFLYNDFKFLAEGGLNYES